MQETTQTMALTRLQAALLLILFLALSWLAVVSLHPPRPLPADAGPQLFSAERAFVHVRAIAGQPRPTGSEANRIVRQYISTQLEALGLSVEAQPFTNRLNNREVRGINLIARLPGRTRTAGPNAVALVCHHDSVERGPGAGDDGAAVATLIETARALKAGPGLENDIFFVFTDGEEIGLLGAQAFVARSPWARRVAVVLNFDARGASGPVYMFETSAGNRWLIRQLARSAPRPAANSLMYEVYRHMPNDTDLTIFRRGGFPGLNFAFIAEPWIYHSPGDTPEHLSRATLQHQGSYALSLARQFGQTDLSQTHEEKNEDSVYFDLFSRALVWYPGSWAIPLAVVGALSLLAAIGVKAGTRQASWGGMAVGFVAWILIFVVIGSVCRCLRPLASAVWPPLPGWRSGLPFLGCGILATLILGLGGHRVLRKWLRPLDLAFAALLWWAILSVATAVWLPGASYVTIWPLAFVLGGILRAAKSPDRSWQRWCWLVFGALPALLLISPLILAFYVALGPDALLVPMIVLALETALLALPLDAALSSG